MELNKIISDKGTHNHTMKIYLTWHNEKQHEHSLCSNTRDEAATQDHKNVINKNNYHYYYHHCHHNNNNDNDYYYNLYHC